MKSKARKQAAAAPVAKKPKATVGDKVVDRIHGHAALFDNRNQVYGDNFIHFGKVMKGMFPEGVQLMTEADFCRFCVFVQVISKGTRYAQNFARGGHTDSLDDTSVYAAMLAEVDLLFKEAA